MQIPQDKKEIDSYKRVLNERGIDPYSGDTYVVHLRKFLDFKENNYYEEITEKLFEDYILHLKEKNLSNSTINLAISALKLFVKHVLGDDRMLEDINRPKAEKNFKLDSLTQEEVINLLNKTEDISYRIVFSLMYGSGLRLKEVVKLKKSDIDIEESLVYIRGESSRKVVLSKYSKKLLKGFLEDFELLDPLFPGASDNKYITTRQVQRKFKEYLSKSEVDRRCSISILRVSYIVHLLKDGVDSFVVAYNAGISYSGMRKYVNAIKDPKQKTKSPLDDTI